MIYCTSDLHGYPLDRFKELLAEADFGDDDFLFVLGDVIDRNGDGGVELLQWLMLQPNAELLLGNHEAMLLSCRFLFSEVTDETLSGLKSDDISLLSGWLANGGRVTLDSLRALNVRDPDAVGDILDFIAEAPLYETVSAGGRDFVLCHSGIGGFVRGKKLSEYAQDDFLWTRPCADDRYFNTALTVFGHTPTHYYACPGRAFHTDTWVDIDTGAAGGGAPMLLRLDDMREFYADI